MRALTKLGGIIVLTLAFASCGSEKKVVTQEPQQQQLQQEKTQISDMRTHLQPINIPCKEESKDDKQYYRALGIGEMVNMSMCIQAASRNAQMQLFRKISNLKNTLSSCTLYVINLHDYIDKINDYIDADITCQEITMTESGHYCGYVVMEVSKENIKNNIINELNRISKEQNLGIDFSEDKFVNYINETMNTK